MQLQSPVEERWNWITHGLGMILAVVGLFWLLYQDTHKTNLSTFSIIVYGISLITLYFASTAYHYTDSAVLKRRFRILDHIGIYLLIAGTYTPVALISLLHSQGWLLFTIVWSIAAVGTILKLFFTGRFEVLSLVFYVVMGWLIVFDFESLSQIISSSGIWFLVLGGLSYTVGIIFYAWKKLLFSHVIWHLFVLAGSVFHYIFILKYVL